MSTSPGSSGSWARALHLPGTRGAVTGPLRGRTPSWTQLLRLPPLTTVFSRQRHPLRGLHSATRNSKPRPLTGEGALGGPRRCAVGGTALAHQVVPTDDGQGQRGVAAPQQAGVRSVGEEEPDDVPGTLGGRDAEGPQAGEARLPGEPGQAVNADATRSAWSPRALAAAQHPGWHRALCTLISEWAGWVVLRRRCFLNTRRFHGK